VRIRVCQSLSYVTGHPPVAELGQVVHTRRAAVRVVRPHRRRPPAPTGGPITTGQRELCAAPRRAGRPRAGSTRKTPPPGAAPTRCGRLDLGGPVLATVNSRAVRVAASSSLDARDSCMKKGSASEDPGWPVDHQAEGPARPSTARAALLAASRSPGRCPGSAGGWRARPRAGLFRAKDTAALVTPARWAMSAIVGRFTSKTSVSTVLLKGPAYAACPRVPPEVPPGPCSASRPRTRGPRAVYGCTPPPPGKGSSLTDDLRSTNRYSTSAPARPAARRCLQRPSSARERS